MRRGGLLFAALIWLALCASTWAVNKNAGTSGAQFLKIGAGARPTAMGDAFVGIADDVNSVYFNPAGVSYITHPEFTAMHTQWFDGMNYDFGAFAYPTDFGALAVSAATLNIKNIDKRGNDETLQSQFSSLDAAYALTYARNVNSLLSAGVTARYIHQSLDSSSAGTWAGDAGLVQRCLRWPLTFGLAIKHVGQPVKFRSESDPLPLTLDAGVGANFLDDKLKMGFDLNKPRDNNLLYGLGAEYTRLLSRDYKAAFRCGYNTAHQDAGGNSGLSLGAGLGYKQFSFDFAWVPLGNLGNSFRYSALLMF